MKVLIGMPALSMIPTKTVASLMLLNKPEGSSTEIIANSLVYDARNILCQHAINGGFDYLLFIDSDMVFPPDSIARLQALNADIATGIYYARQGNKHEPIVYKKLTKRSIFNDAHADHFETIPNGIFDVAGCGMGLCLIKADAIEKLCKRYHYAPFEPFGGMGEDFCFCYRAKKMGLTIKADGNLQLGHIGERIYTRADYVPTLAD